MPYDPSENQQASLPRGNGKPLKTTQLTQYEARQEALQLLHEGVLGKRSKARALIALMNSAGIVTAAHLKELLNVNERSLRRYREKNYLERVLISPALESFLPPQTYFVYALGMVGIELATLIHGRTPTGYIEAQQDKVSHDLLTNLVYYHLYKGVKPLGYTAILYSRYEATIHDYKGKPLLEPDAMIVLKHPTRARQVYLMEYHHEDFGRRTAGKVVKYDNVLRDHPDEWQAKWQTPTPPTVLVIWTHKAVGTGYAKYFAEQRTYNAQPLARWLGKPLQAFLNKQTVLLWDNLGTGTSNEALIG
jgi:hypothetical protein